MNDKPNKLLLVPVLVLLFVMIGYQYICPAGSQSCHFGTGDRLRSAAPPPTGSPAALDELRREPEAEEEEDESPARLAASRFNFTQRDLARHVDFDIRGDDVIVFLHIQKTGGTTFGRHLVRNIRLERPCDCRPGQKKCSCHRPGRDESWLFSRFSTGWSCGLHADWTELTNCVPVLMEKKQQQASQRRSLSAQSCGVSGCLHCEVALKEEEAAQSVLAFSQQPEQEARARKVRHVRADQQALLQQRTRERERERERERWKALRCSLLGFRESLHLSELSPLSVLWRAAC